MTEQVNRKYEFVEGGTIYVKGSILKRIRAIRDFGNIKKGDLGRYIEKEENLSHEGNCWVDGDAKAYGDFSVYENALITGSARVYGGAEVYENVQVCGDAEVYGYAKVYGEAEVYGDTKVCVAAIISQNARLCGDVTVTDSY